MFVINFDIWPYGDGSKKETVFKIVGYNDGSGSPSSGKYETWVFDKGAGVPIPSAREIRANQEDDGFINIGHHITIEQHSRLDGIQELVRRILVEYDLNKHGVTTSTGDL